MHTCMCVEVSLTHLRVNTRCGVGCFISVVILNDCIALFFLASADYQPTPEVSIPNNKTENGQADVKER